MLEITKNKQSKIGAYNNEQFVPAYNNIRSVHLYGRIGGSVLD